MIKKGNYSGIHTINQGFLIRGKTQKVWNLIINFRTNTNIMLIIIMTISTTNLSLTLSDQNGKTMLFKEYTRWQSVEYKLYYAEWCYAERLFAECHGSELDFLLKSVVQFFCHVYGTRRNGQSQKIMSPKSQLAKKSIWTKNDQQLSLASWLICN